MNREQQIIIQEPQGWQEILAERVAEMPDAFWYMLACICLAAIAIWFGLKSDKK